MPNALAGNPGFSTTRWSLVHRAGSNDPEAAQRAFSELCRLYWVPVYVLMQRRCPEGPAQDLTQEFFLRLHTVGFGTVDPAKGRLRAWLCGAVRNFAINHRAYVTAARRDYRRETSFEEWHSSSEPNVAQTRAPAPDREFDRRWALKLLDDVMTTLGEECRVRGRAQRFERLRPFLAGHRPDGDYAAVAESLGTTAGALRVQVSRLRARFRELLLARVRSTVARDDEVAAELRSLLDSLRDDE